MLDDLGGLPTPDVNDDLIVAPAVGSERHRRSDLVILRADEFEIRRSCRSATFDECRTWSAENFRDRRSHQVRSKAVAGITAGKRRPHELGEVPVVNDPLADLGKATGEYRQARSRRLAGLGDSLPRRVAQ